MIGIDMKAWFVPAHMKSDVLTPEERRERTVMGDIIYVNYAHKIFTVEFPAGSKLLKETFNFSDCGKSVRVRG